MPLIFNGYYNIFNIVVSRNSMYNVEEEYLDYTVLPM